jgi:hypothetical protein
MYKITKTILGATVIILEKDGLRLSFIEDEANSDYQAYLAWVAEGNTATEWSPEA